MLVIYLWLQLLREVENVCTFNVHFFFFLKILLKILFDLTVFFFFATSGCSTAWHVTSYNKTNFKKIFNEKQKKCWVRNTPFFTGLAFSLGTSAVIWNKKENVSVNLKLYYKRNVLFLASFIYVIHMDFKIE